MPPMLTVLSRVGTWVKRVLTRGTPDPSDDVTIGSWLDLEALDTLEDQLLIAQARMLVDSAAAGPPPKGFPRG